MPRVLEPANGRDGVRPRLVCLTPQLILCQPCAPHETAAVVPRAGGMVAQECKMTISKAVKLQFYL